VVTTWGGDEASRLPEQARRLSVLVADDNVDAADSLAMLLRLWGHDVRVAYDGRTVLQLARESRPDVVLCETDLPGLDMTGLAAGLRPALLIAVTVRGRLADRVRSREAGFAYHLVKPADPGDLLELLAGVAWRKGQVALAEVP